MREGEGGHFEDSSPDRVYRKVTGVTNQMEDTDEEDL